MRRIWVVGWLAAGLPAAARTASAQTTDTERSAAREVVQQIDALQARLKPTEAGRRMAGKKDADRDRLFQRIDQLWTGEMQSLSDYIGKHPEVGFKEFKSVDTLTSVLRGFGFRVETGVAGLETAVAIADYMKEKRLPGRIRVFGTPAEEVGPPSKVTMWEAGIFKGTDILVRSHGSGSTARSKAGFGVCCLNINEVRYIFTGRSSHQRSSWFGRNALSAAVQLYTAVDHLRPTFRPEASIQGVIPEGGVAPNVVPERAVVDYYIRYPDEVYLDHIDSMMANAARGAAAATGTQDKIENYGRRSEEHTSEL